MQIINGTGHKVTKQGGGFIKGTTFGQDGQNVPKYRISPRTSPNIIAGYLIK